MVITYWQLLCSNFSDYLSLSTFTLIRSSLKSQAQDFKSPVSSEQKLMLSHHYLSLQMCCIVSTQQLSSFCPLGPKVMRWKCLTRITAITGAASQWSRPRPQTPAEMPTQSPELLSNPSLSPLILLDRVSSEHHSTHNQTCCSGFPLQQCNNRWEQLVRSAAWMSFLCCKVLRWPQAGQRTFKCLSPESEI